MKKSLFLSLTLFTSLLLAFASCKKEQNQETSTTITLTSPANGTSFHSGDTILLTGSIASEIELHGYEVKLINVSDSNRTLYAADVHEHATSYALNHSIPLMVMDHSDLELTVTAVVDHDGNTQSKKLNLHCHPH